MTQFRVWAPHASTVALNDGTAMVMKGGWWRAAAPLHDYGFSIDGGPVRPDPRSPWQPEGVHALSRGYDHDEFTWTDRRWHGVPLAGAVLYELHVGTFTPEGTFDAAIGKLDHLVELGVSAVELLPCNAFDGRWGWGYEGVALFAVHEPYGGPDGLKRFVDAAHAKGLGVVMDVVYNHLGPSGNYLAEFGPYFTDEHHTPWGSAVDLQRPEVRRFFLDNALMWLRDYHLDGLRLDAVHALVDESATHLLEEMAQEVAALGAQLGKPLFLIAESDLNDPKVIDPHGWRMDGQWCDDVHHALHALLTGETFGYYVDFGSLETTAKALTSPFVHDGSWSTFRGRPHGRPVPPDVPGWRFVVYLQDHDQVGNRARGDRPALSPGLARVGAALYLLSPYTPMLFMGEEYGARTPWLFFSDHSGALGDAVREGRRAEFATHGWRTDEVPDPQDPATFQRSKLDWRVDPGLLRFYKELIALRRSRTDLSDGRRDHVGVTWDEDARWLVMTRGSVAICCNLAPQRQALAVPGSPQHLLLASAPGWIFQDQRVETDGESVVVVELAPHPMP
ncbi:MAG: maltooligosyl trehalose hydrolase [Frankiales bacterium]|jgi:maltooligosyltrehalose trehalohydrolase|nr:maltooligosyl trehalose hydrolase [Frankiales bacterium]